MAPDRGDFTVSSSLNSNDYEENETLSDSNVEEDHEGLWSEHDNMSRLDPIKDVKEARNFTFRGLLVGSLIGIVICFSNMYFGLQTGWISSMAMPSALIGFAFFKSVSRSLDYPFTPVENVFVQSVAGSVGTMPLGCGFVGVIPALSFLLRPEENGPLDLSLLQLIVWSVGICFFGVIFAVPLRRQVIIREKLKFPSGTACALMIGVLHGKVNDRGFVRSDSKPIPNNDTGETGQVIGDFTSDPRDENVQPIHRLRSNQPLLGSISSASDEKSAWRSRIRLLFVAFLFSAGYTLISYFIPQLQDLPFLGYSLASTWLWTFNPSPAYIGQGIIMGPTITLHMFLGAVLGWGILSPLAKGKGWAPGNVTDWETGSKGWIVWISLAIMLADALVSMGWLVFRPIFYRTKFHFPRILHYIQRNGLTTMIPIGNNRYDILSEENLNGSDSMILNSSQEMASSQISRKISANVLDDVEEDAPKSQLISRTTVVVGLFLSITLSVASVHYTFAGLIPISLTFISMILALLLSVMGVRALGETDLNPVSGISKLTQLLLAFFTSKNNKNAVIINLIAGALSESGALQAGDLMQDLKTGHLLGAAPNAQFYGQLIGSAVGAVVSALVYKLYTSVYEVPGKEFEVPTGYVWIFTARLVMGKGLPRMAAPWAYGAGLLFAVITGFRTWGRVKGLRWTQYIPGGIAVAVGMYNVPSFTLARTVGGLVTWYWQSHKKRQETPTVIVASGLILGEGLFSIVKLILTRLNIPHL